MATLNAPGGRPSLDQIVEELRVQLSEISEGALSPESIDAAGHLFDYGYVDSLSAVTFLAQIEDRYGVQIDDIDLIERLHSVHAIAQHIDTSL
jgi:acyl carrier protein